MRDYTSGWDIESLRYAVDEFDRRIKAEFTGDEDEVHSILVHGLLDSCRHGIIGGCLELSAKELKEHVFDDVTTKIQGLVRDQIATTSDPIKTILLAGGFGQSSYLKQQLESMPSVKSKNIQVQHIENR